MSAVIVALAVLVPPAATAIVLWTRRRGSLWFLPYKVADPMRDQRMLALQTALHAEQDRHMRNASVFGLTAWVACCCTLVGRAYSETESSIIVAKMAPLPVICFVAGVFAMRPTDRTTIWVVVLLMALALACIAYEVSGTHAPKKPNPLVGRTLELKLVDSRLGWTCTPKVWFCKSNRAPSP